MKRLSKKFQKVVVKVGSSILTGAGNAIAARNMDRVARSIVSLVKGQGRDVIVVTSGAIASGLSALGLKKRPSSLPELQAAAAIGQNILIQAYSREFEKYGLKCAQILLTREDFGDRKRYLNVKSTIHTLLGHKVIPIINENDAVSTDEIKFGDNDTLSARVAAAVEADALLLLTDIDGLYRDFDPGSRTGVLIREVRQITPEIERLACGTDKASCVGGMSTKIEAAKIATNMGVPVFLVNGLKDDFEIDLSASPPGTYFPAVESIGSKKHWIAYEAKAAGRVIVDDGAKAALAQNARSLLAPGVTDIEGSFKAGDIVEIVDGDGEIFAKGKVKLSSAELASAKGKKVKGEVVHRDDLVIL